MSTSRTRQVSKKVNCETCEKLRQSAQRSAVVLEQCGRRSYNGVAEQKVWDSLPARVCGRSREDLLAREFDHGTLKHQPFFFPRKFGCLLGTLSNISHRFSLPYFLGRIFSWWVASSSPHFRGFWMPNNNNHKFERYWESRIWLGSSLAGPDSINREFWGRVKCNFVECFTTNNNNHKFVWCWESPIWLHLLLEPGFITWEFWVKVKCNSVECLHNKQQQSQN